MKRPPERWSIVIAAIAAAAGVRADICMIAVPSRSRLRRGAPPGERGEHVGAVGLGGPDRVEAEPLRLGDRLDGAVRAGPRPSSRCSVRASVRAAMAAEPIFRPRASRCAPFRSTLEVELARVDRRPHPVRVRRRNRARSRPRPRPSGSPRSRRPRGSPAQSCSTRSVDAAGERSRLSAHCSFISSPPGPGRRPRAPRRSRGRARPLARGSRRGPTRRCARPGRRGSPPPSGAGRCRIGGTARVIAAIVSSERSSGRTSTLPSRAKVNVFTPPKRGRVLVLLADRPAEILDLDSARALGEVGRRGLLAGCDRERLQRADGVGPGGTEARAGRHIAGRGEVERRAVPVACQRDPQDRVLDVGRVGHVLLLEVLEPVAVLRRGGHEHVHVTVDRGRDGEAAVLGEVRGKVGPAAPERDAQRGAGDDDAFHAPHYRASTGKMPSMTNPDDRRDRHRRRADSVWRSAGFDVDDEMLLAGTVPVRLAGNGAGKRIVGWSLRDLDSDELDGLPTERSDAPIPDPPGGRSPERSPRASTTSSPSARASTAPR